MGYLPFPESAILLFLPAAVPRIARICVHNPFPAPKRQPLNFSLPILFQKPVKSHKLQWDCLLFASHKVFPAPDSGQSWISVHHPAAARASIAFSVPKFVVFQSIQHLLSLKNNRSVCFYCIVVSCICQPSFLVLCVLKRNMRFNFTIDFKFCIVFFLKQCYTKMILGVSAVKKQIAPSSNQFAQQPKRTNMEEIMRLLANDGNSIMNRAF